MLRIVIELRLVVAKLTTERMRRIALYLVAWIIAPALSWVGLISAAKHLINLV